MRIFLVPSIAYTKSLTVFYFFFTYKIRCASNSSAKKRFQNNFDKISLLLQDLSQNFRFSSTGSKKNPKISNRRKAHTIHTFTHLDSLSSFFPCQCVAIFHQINIDVVGKSLSSLFYCRLLCRAFGIWKEGRERENMQILLTQKGN
jgi:hypothetical protein